ncbi:TonB-dependent receptor SusC precursor [mine drainage metagenome]|uniref:TonB-dependent receptor SusC n=1 Tax=mine drainage metagenome TaxID=410659 RepID=A0A1J5RF48_9ZZZZ
MHMKKVYLGFFLSLLLFSSATWAQNKTVTGKVVGENGAAIPNASVIAKNTKIATSANANGEFAISVPSTVKVLIISSVGFASVEEPINGRSRIEVKLNPVAENLKDVVVTALGIKRETKALGYSVQKISGESLQKVSGVDVATSLTGKVAGLLVKNSSDFGAVPDLTIRGEKPLLVIDGIAYANKTLTDISSEDIESITVLKGATASALYGNRGGQGALLITTKNGSSNKEGITIDYTTNTMFTAGFLAIPAKQAVYGRGSNNTYDKNSDNSWGTKMDGSIQNQWDPKLKAYRDYAYLPIGANNFKNFLEQGYITNNNFNVGYKKDNISLRSSLNWTENKGRYPNSTLDKYTYTFGGDFTSNKFKLSSNLSYARKSSPNLGSNGYTSYDPMYELLIWSAADFNILDYKNNYWLKPGEIQNYTYQSGDNNPYFDRYEKINKVSRDIFNADMSMSYQITDWLKATVRSGLDFYKEVGELKVSWGSQTYTGNTPVPGNQYTWNGYKTGGYVIGQNSGFSMNSDLLLTGDRSYKKFKVDYLAGATIFKKRDDNLYANTNGGIAVPGFFSIKASVQPATVTESTAAQQINSVFGRVAFSWNKMAFIEATGRNDWSSTLPASTRSYFYPSISSSFVISELLPYRTKSWLDLLKVRGSWTSSKTIPGIYAINSSFSLNNATWGTLNGATAPSNIYSKDARPESNNTFETGVQAMFLKNRFMVDVSYYSKRNFDRLANAPLTASSGYTSSYININEELTRKGWEVVLNGAVLKKKDLQINFGANWSTFKRFITKIDPKYSAKKPWVYQGARYDVLYSKAFLKDPSGNLIYNNGRLVYSSYDSKFGYTDPDWIWGINSTVRYKNFSLYVSFDGVHGGLMNTRTESYMWQAGVHPNSVTAARAADVATPGSKNFLGDGVKVTSGTVAYDALGNITADTRVFAKNDVYTTYKQYIVDLHNSSAWGGNGSSADTYSKTFFKLREISLTYQLPNKILHGIAKAASVSFIGQNVLLKAKDFKYSDPDGGTEDFADASTRYLGMNIKLTF